MSGTLLLTGASGEIGGAIAARFVQAGYEVMAPDRTVMDLADNQSIRAYIAQLQRPVDVFIHCAGFNQPKLVGDLTRADLDKTLQINTLAFFELVCGLLPHFKQQKGGAIIGVSSLYGTFARKGRLAYATAKHALNGMIKTLALELGADNIRVNGIAPGFVDTRMTRANNSEQTIESFRRKIPLGRLATPAEIANVCYFLASPENTYIHGEILTVDGGYSQGGFQE